MRRGYRDDLETADFPGERIFSAQVPIKYVLQEATERRDALIVGFSAIHPPDKAPRYYSHKVLRDLPCHRLFVLDDHGPREPLPRPCWYLGRDRRFDVADSMCDLLEEIMGELGVQRGRVITCGASKGGWAALYFGARLGAGHALAGEPQTLLGKYLCQPDHEAIAKHVAGGTSTEASDFLDALLFDAFRAAEAAPCVHVYSGRGRYLEHHIVPFLKVLGELGVPWELELGDHADHVPDLGLKFPGYLTRRVAELLEEIGLRDGGGKNVSRSLPH